MKTRILYEDAQLLIIYKPTGLATQTSQLMQEDVVGELKNYLRSPYIGVIHRLDQPVEGLLVFARDRKTAAALTAQMQDGMVRKEYRAVSYGTPGEIWGDLAPGEVTDVGHTRIERMTSGWKLRTFLRKVGAGVGAAVDASDPEGRESILNLDQVATRDGCTLWKVRLETGRFHQIRLQLSDSGLPLLGDVKYGSDESRRKSDELGVNDGVSLCADYIEVLNPKTKKRLEQRIEPQGKAFSIFRIA